MRGCLFVVLLAALFVLVGVWFGGPPLASAVVTSGLHASGLQADYLDVDVHSDPPLELAAGHADEVGIRGTHLEWNGLRAGSIDLTLNDVDLVSRTAGAAEGRLELVDLPNVDPPGSTGTVVIDGPADSAATTITIDGETIEAMALAAFETKLGVRPDRATLTEPNLVHVQAGAVELSGALVVGPDGSIGVATPLGVVPVIKPDPSGPVRLTGVGVQDGSLVLTGTLDVESLLQ
jgi:hypothetical protein